MTDKALKPAAFIALLILIDVRRVEPQLTIQPLQVTLNLVKNKLGEPICPSKMFNEIGLAVQYSGGIKTLTPTVQYRVNGAALPRYPGEISADTLAWYDPPRPGWYEFSATVTQIGPTKTMHATARRACVVEKVVYEGVVASVNPPVGQVPYLTPMTVYASIPRDAIANAGPLLHVFSFSYWIPGSLPHIVSIIRKNDKEHLWEPEPAQPTVAGSGFVHVRISSYRVGDAESSVNEVAYFDKTMNWVVNATVTPTVPFGWLNAITTQNTTEPVGTPIGAAEDAIAGHTIKAIATDPSVRVRAVNMACAECHPPGPWADRMVFCSAADQFINNQGTHKDDLILKNLFRDWRSRAPLICPD